MISNASRFVRINKFEELTGWTAEAVRGKIKTGVWRERQQYRRVQGQILIDMEGYEKWVESGGTA